MSRRLAREIAIQALYQREIHPEDQGGMIDQLTEKLNSDDYRFFQQLTQGVEAHQEVIDQYISRYLKESWPLHRLTTIDRSILRLATYELLYRKKTPHKAILNEAVDLAKAFSGLESSRFINGVLGGLIEECR